MEDREPGPGSALRIVTGEICGAGGLEAGFA
jgi:hypothetical protein